mgnify:FL=1
MNYEPETMDIDCDDMESPDVIVRIKSIISWCLDFWDVRKKQEDDAKRQRFKIAPEDLQKVVNFIDQDGSGTISIQEFQEVFSMIKRHEAMKSMGSEGLVVMKRILGTRRGGLPTIDNIVSMFDKSNGGTINRRELRRGLQEFGFGDAELDAAVNALDPTGRNCLDTIEFGANLRKAEGEVNLLKVEERRKKIWDERFREAEQLALKEQRRQEESFTTKEMQLVINFMDPDKSNSIDLEEFFHAFRKARRAKASEKTHQEGVELMKELEQFLVDERMTLIKFFNSVDTSFKKSHLDDSDSEDEEDAEWYPGGVKPEKVDPHKAIPEGTITALELTKGLQHLGCGFTDTEVGLIMRYMDPNSDGSLSFAEVADSFRKLHHKTEAEILEEQVGGILMRIEDFIKEKGIRILNVFQELDKDNSGSITGEELIFGLEKLKEPSGKLKALIKRKNEAEEAQRAEAMEKGDVAKRARHKGNVE